MLERPIHLARLSDSPTPANGAAANTPPAAAPLDLPGRVSRASGRICLACLILLLVGIVIVYGALAADATGVW